MKLYFVYILQCADNSYYTGITSNLDKRLEEHNSGKHRSSYTFSRRPLKLVWIENFTDPNQAIMVEKQINGWSHGKKKAMIEQDWDKLVRFSQNRYKRGLELD